MPSPLPSPTESPWRYERKFEAQGASPSEIEMRLRLHRAGFRTAFPSRFVNSVYLDHSDMRSFRIHVNGAPAREKLRIRWYGEPGGAVERPVLEVKRKRGHVGTKLHYPLAPFAYGPGFDFAAVQRDALARIDDSDVAEFVSMTSPKLCNRYRRRYLLSADGRFRLTIDTELRFERVPGQPPIGPFGAVDERGTTVLELKYAVADDRAAEAIVNQLPFRLSKYSKYLTGVARLGGFSL